MTLLLAAVLCAAVSSAVRTQGADAGWQPLFDGKTLGSWQSTKFGGEGAVKPENGQIVLETGKSLTGITWAGAELPKTNYEIALQAMRVEGRDFFAGITFPVGDSFCSLILGGWGGSVVGLSSINFLDASENETSQSIDFENGRWYSVAHQGHAGQDPGVARRSADHQPGSEGQQDQRAHRGRGVRAARRRDVEDERRVARHPHAPAVEV